MPLICSIAGFTEVWKKKNHIRLATLYRMDGSNRHLRRFLQCPSSSSRRDRQRELYARMKLRPDVLTPALKQLPEISGGCLKRPERGGLEQFVEPLHCHRKGILGCVNQRFGSRSQNAPWVEAIPSTP